MKCHPDQLKNVQNSKDKRFCFVLTLWPLAKVKISGSDKMAEVNGAYKHGRYEIFVCKVWV